MNCIRRFWVITLNKFTKIPAEVSSAFVYQVKNPNETIVEAMISLFDAEDIYFVNDVMKYRGRWLKENAALSTKLVLRCNCVLMDNKLLLYEGKCTSEVFIANVVELLP